MCEKCDQYFAGLPSGDLYPEARRLAIFLAEMTPEPTIESAVFLLAAGQALQDAARKVIALDPTVHITPTMEDVAARAAAMAVKLFMATCTEEPPLIITPG
jgi:hypothetical protein